MAFYGCTSLASVFILGSVYSIGDGAFGNCKELADVYCHAVTLPETSSDAFQDSYIEYATLHVPAEAMNTYKTTEPWSSFGAFEALDDGTSVNTVKMRGVTIQSDGGFVTISGLDNGEQVRFFSVDGKMLGEVKAADGTACFAATRGSVVIAKIGSDSVKIAVE